MLRHEAGRCCWDSARRVHHARRQHCHWWHVRRVGLLRLLLACVQPVRLSSRHWAPLQEVLLRPLPLVVVLLLLLLLLL